MRRGRDQKPLNWEDAFTFPRAHMKESSFDSRPTPRLGFKHKVLNICSKAPSLTTSVKVKDFSDKTLKKRVHVTVGVGTIKRPHCPWPSGTSKIKSPLPVFDDISHESQEAINQNVKLL